MQAYYIWFYVVCKAFILKIRHNPTFVPEIFFIHNAQLYNLYIMHYIHIFLSVIIMAILEYMSDSPHCLLHFTTSAETFLIFPKNCCKCQICSKQNEDTSIHKNALPVSPSIAYYFPQLKRETYLIQLNAFIPGYTALAPSSSSMRRSWLYLATRSDLLGAPVLIWQVFSATARSAIVVSAVSPER